MWWRRGEDAQLEDDEYFLEHEANEPGDASEAGSSVDTVRERTVSAGGGGTKEMGCN